MNDILLDTRLVAATPRRSDDTDTFVKQTMQKIKAQAPDASPKRTFWQWLGHLHKPVLALFALLTLALATGVVYAAVNFAPALIELIGKQTNSRGATEYTVAGYADCAKNYGPIAERFEVKANAPHMDDQEVRKILQAACELKWIEEFTAKTWPTYGTNPTWKDGDTIYYARTDMLGTFKKADGTSATVGKGDFHQEYQVPQGETLKAYHAGAAIPLNDVKPGDAVFSIVRVNETYYERTQPIINKMQGIHYTDYNANPQIVGILAVFKMSLPLEYYEGTKQRYLTEIPTCMGNKPELCPNTPYIEVYPREGGEGATNPYLNSEYSEFKQISGTVTELSADRMTLKSRKGNVYSVTVGDNGFAVYQNNYAKNYSETEGTLKVGSNVTVDYVQPTGGDAKIVAKDQVVRIGLMLEAVNPKTDGLKPY